MADIQYNFINLPSRIEFENGHVISYLYDADGIKLRTTHVDQSGNVEEVNHYYPFGGLLSSSVSNAVQPY